MHKTSFFKKATSMIVATVFALTISFSVQKPEPANAFLFLLLRDVAEDMAKEVAKNKFKQAIEYIYRTGIVDGYEDGTFKPDATINRAELVKILVSALKLPVDTTNTKCFSDFSGQEWFAPFACAAKSKNLISGYPDGSFGGSKTVNKAEALKIILNAFKIEKSTNTNSIYTDVSANDWFAGYAGAARDGNLIDGANEKSLNPSALLTRASIADLIFRNVGVSQTKALYDQYFEYWKNKNWEKAYELISNTDKVSMDFEDFKFVNENADIKIEKINWRGGFKLNTGEIATISGDYSLNYTLPNDLDAKELFSYQNTATGVFENGTWKIRSVSPTKATVLNKTVSSENGVNSITLNKIISGPQHTILIGALSSTANCTLALDDYYVPRITSASGEFHLSYKSGQIGDKVYWMADKTKNGFLEFTDDVIDFSSNNLIASSGTNDKCNDNHWGSSLIDFNHSTLKNIPLSVNGR